MPAIHFKNGRAPIDVPPGSKLMQSLQEAGLPVASSCRGDGVCAKCRMTIVNGAENLSRESDLELFLRERHGLEKDERISCQTFIHGDITVATPYW